MKCAFLNKLDSSEPLRIKAVFVFLITIFRIFTQYRNNDLLRNIKKELSADKCMNIYTQLD